MEKTSLGMDENIEGALCYLLGFVTGIVFLLLEKDNKFVKFHAVQSIAISLLLFVIGMIISAFVMISFSTMWLFGGLYSLLSLIELVLWLVLMIKAYQGEKFKLPVVGEIAEKQSL